MLTLFSPAKINLFLRILSKRPDGYHNLSSLFQTISLGDTLSIEPSNEVRLTCTSSDLPTDQSNLILKATALFRKKTGLNAFFKMHLEKRIPTQAGLGGGSSNAATALWACNQLTKANIPLQTLQEWGAEIGSDVPFFLSEGTAHCSGRGEVIVPFPGITSQPFWIVKPNEGLSTPEVYRRFKMANTSSMDSIDAVENDLQTVQSGFISYFNDLETAAFEVKPEFIELKNLLLKSGFETVLMSGSGSAFFCMGNGKMPTVANASIYSVSFVNRSASDWYKS